MESEMKPEFSETSSPPPESSELWRAAAATSHSLDPSVEKAESANFCLTDMDCPICFNGYHADRVPKELACGHVFCARCLKLLVRNEAGTWLVPCPVCRAPTSVFGGLVGTLQNRETLMGRLQDPEVSTPGGAKLPGPDHASADDGRNGGLRTAAMRLVILLLMLVIVLVIVLQFLCTGIIKWVLGFILGVVVIVTVLLCFNPYCAIRLTQAPNPA
ncbi:E3 ubiquitin-protein ligase RNF186 [Gastrophryne carolinensis]